MGEELRNIEWILANVSLWLLPLLSFSIFILFFSSYIAIYILNVVDGLRNLFLFVVPFSRTSFRSSIFDRSHDSLTIEIVCNCLQAALVRIFESGLFPSNFSIFFQFFLFFFLFFDKFEGAKEPFYREEIAATLIDIDIRNKFIFGTIW